MSFCNECGNELNQGVFYCSKCGGFVGEKSTKIEPVIGKDEFCNHCGTKVNYNYCKKCGQPSVHMSIKRSMTPTESIKTNLSQVAQTIKLPKKDDLLNQQMYQEKLVQMKEKMDWRKLFLNGAIFAVVVNFLGILLGVVVELIMKSALKDAGFTATQVKGVRHLLQIKGNVLSLLYGMKTQVKISAKGGELFGNNMNISLVFPWVMLLILILFICIAEVVRRNVTKEKKTVGIVAVNSLINGVLVTFLMLIFLHKQNVTNNVLLNQLTYYYDDIKLYISHGGIGLQSICYVFLVCFALQMILPGFTFQNEILQRGRNTVKALFRVLLVISLVGGISFAFYLVKNVSEGSGVLVLQMIEVGVGAFLSILTSGGLSLMSGKFGDTSMAVKLGVFQLKIQGDGEIGVHNPFAFMQLILVTIFFILLVMVAIGYWRENEAKTKAAVLQAGGISAMLSILIALLSRLCTMWISTKSGILSLEENSELYFGNTGSLGIFIRTFLYVFVVFLISYLIQKYQPKLFLKIPVVKTSALATVSVVIASVVILLRCFTFSEESFEKTAEDLQNIDYTELSSVIGVEDEIEDFFESFEDLYDLFGENLY